MPRRNVSKFDYLRPEIIESFLQGKTGGELVAEYPQIPRRTVYRWLKEVRDLTGTPLTQPKNDKPTALSECQSGHRANLVVLPMSNTVEDTLPDLLYLKRKLRTIINTDGDNLSKNDGIRVNAINAYLKLVLAEFGNKNIAIEEDDDIEEAAEIDYDNMTEEELANLIHKKLRA
jgi:hypothetical protein